MPSPLYLIQAWDSVAGRPFIHETKGTQEDAASIGADLAESQYGDWRIDRVVRFCPDTLKTLDVTAHALNAAIIHATSIEGYLPDNVIAACERNDIDVPQWVIHPADRLPPLPEVDPYTAFRGLGRRAA